ncbi:MAG TPA: DUF2203 domain-containing protein [Candidatus Binatia bacterium]|nr:DUF2203 domain-containing protein [Candidatus Binatia bacterium]
MGRFYTIDSANARLPEVRAILERLRQQRAELIALRDELAARQGEARPGTSVPGKSGGAHRRAKAASEAQALRLRMRGIIDQMEAAVQQLVDWDIALRDIESGLIDFPALANGRQIWLCWRLGEDEITWWHELEAGFAGRRPLIDLT